RCPPELACGAGEPEPAPPQYLAHLSPFELDAQKPLGTLQSEPHRVACRKLGARLAQLPGRTAANLDDELGRALECDRRSAEIHAALEAVGGVGSESQHARLA